MDGLEDIFGCALVVLAAMFVVVAVSSFCVGLLF